jgi:hypothetical protein
MLLIYDNAESRKRFSGPEGEPLMDEMRALLSELKETGEFVSTDGLADPSQTKVVRMRDGVPAVTDGPLAEAKEHFGGYLIVDCETPERATDIAARFPSTRFTPLEVRPIMDSSGAEM